MEQLSFTQNMAFQPAAVVAAGAVSSSGPKVPAARATASGSERRSASGFGGNVTEIILPEEQVENFQLLLFVFVLQALLKQMVISSVKKALVSLW